MGITTFANGPKSERTCQAPLSMFRPTHIANAIRVEGFGEAHGSKLAGGTHLRMRAYGTYG